MTTSTSRRRGGTACAGSSRSSAILSATAAAAAVAVVGASSSSTSTSASPIVRVAHATTSSTAAGSFGVVPAPRAPFQLHHAVDIVESLRGGSSTGGSENTGDAAAAQTQDVPTCDVSQDKSESNAGGNMDGSAVRGGAIGIGEAEKSSAKRKKKKKSKKKKKTSKSGGDAATAEAEAEASATNRSSSSTNTPPAASAGESSSASSSATDTAAADDKPRYHHSKHGHHHSSHSKSHHHHDGGKSSSHRTSSKRRGCAQQDAIIQNILSASDHYNVLDVAKTATEVEIKKAYRRCAVRTHPDKVPNGDRTAFDKVAKAYEILGDEGKRALYDRFGDAGVEAGGNPNPGFGGFGGGPGGMFQSAGGTAEDMFRTFFGAGGPGMAGSGVNGRPPNPFQPRNRNARYQMEVTLEDLYGGLTRTVTIAQPAASAGKRRKTVEVTVPRGMTDGQTVVLPGEIDHVAGSAPADVIFVLAQRRHPVFSRRGHDLAIEVTISLREALCGFRRSILHLDGRTVVIRPPRASGKRQPKSPSEDEEANAELEGKTREAPVLVRTGDVHVLRGEGMPKPAGSKSNGAGGFGDLYVQYKVEMPSATSGAGDNLTMKERDELDRLLCKLEGKVDADAPAENSTSIGDDRIDENGNTIRYLERASASDFGRASGIFEKDHHHGEEHLHGDEGDDHPHSSFFHAFGGGRGGPASGFQYFSSSSRDPSQDDPNVQCQQM